GMHARYPHLAAHERQAACQACHLVCQHLLGHVTANVTSSSDSRRRASPTRGQPIEIPRRQAASLVLTCRHSDMRNATSNLLTYAVLGILSAPSCGGTQP